MSAATCGATENEKTPDNVDYLAATYEDVAGVPCTRCNNSVYAISRLPCAPRHGGGNRGFDSRFRRHRVRSRIGAFT